MTELNYIGAISAYSHGIKLSPKMAVLYLNRSKAHIQVKNYHKAIEDATTVSIAALLNIYVYSYNNIIIRCLATRGFYRIEKPRPAVLRRLSI